MRTLFIVIYLILCSVVYSQNTLTVKQLPGGGGATPIFDSTARAEVDTANIQIDTLEFDLIEEFGFIDRNLDEIDALNEATDLKLWQYLNGLPTEPEPDPIPEPDPDTNDTIQIIFQQDFTNTSLGDYNFAEWGRDWNYPTSANHALGYGTIVLEGSNKVMRHIYPAGTYKLGQHGAQWGTKFGTGYDDLWSSYRVKFTGRVKGKLPGLGGGTMESGGYLPDGTDGFSCRMLFFNPETTAVDIKSKIGYYMYYWEMYKAYGDASPVDGKSYYGVSSIMMDPYPGSTQMLFDANRWYTITQHVVLNTPGQSNGYVEGFVDGVKRTQRTGINFRKISSLKLDMLIFCIFFNTPQYPYIDQTIWFDDFIVYRKIN